MEVQLIDGRFSVAEAEQILIAIVNVKIAFHAEKIKSLTLTPEEIKHSETRIHQLEKKLKQVVEKMKAKELSTTNIHAYIDIKFPPSIGQ